MAPKTRDYDKDKGKENKKKKLFCVSSTKSNPLSIFFYYKKKITYNFRYLEDFSH